MNEFFAMGGHAAFIWPAWGLTALGVAILVIGILAERRAASAWLKREQEDGGA